MFADPRTEWRIGDIERDVRGKADRHEVAALRSDVDSLERALRESRAEIDGLRSELEACLQRVREIERVTANTEE